MIGVVSLQYLKPITIRTVWGVRKEPADMCTDRLAAHLQGLARLHPSLAAWFEKGDDPTPRGKVDPENRPRLAQLVSEGRNRTDMSGEVIEDLGFGVHLWNGQAAHQSAATSILCGCHSPFVSNVATLKLVDWEFEQISLAFLADILKTLVDIWDPDEGSVFQLVQKGQELEERTCCRYSRRSLLRFLPWRGDQNQDDGSVWASERGFGLFELGDTLNSGTLYLIDASS